MSLRAQSKGVSMSRCRDVQGPGRRRRTGIESSSRLEGLTYVCTSSEAGAFVLKDRKTERERRK